MGTSSAIRESVSDGEDLGRRSVEGKIVVSLLMKLCEILRKRTIPFHLSGN